MTSHSAILSSCPTGTGRTMMSPRKSPADNTFQGFSPTAQPTTKQKPGENLTSKALFASSCKTNHPQQQRWAAQINFLLSPLKETRSKCSFVFVSTTGFGSQSLLGPAPCWSQWTSPFSTSGAAPGSHRKPLPQCGRRGQSDVH